MTTDSKQVSNSYFFLTGATCASVALSSSEPLEYQPVDSHDGVLRHVGAASVRGRFLPVSCLLLEATPSRDPRYPLDPDAFRPVVTDALRFALLCWTSSTGLRASLPDLCGGSDKTMAGLPVLAGVSGEGPGVFTSSRSCSDASRAPSGIFRCAAAGRAPCVAPSLVGSLLGTADSLICRQFDTLPLLTFRIRSVPCPVLPVAAVAGPAWSSRHLVRGGCEMARTTRSLLLRHLPVPALRPIGF